MLEGDGYQRVSIHVKTKLHLAEAIHLRTPVKDLHKRERKVIYIDPLKNFVFSLPHFFFNYPIIFSLSLLPSTINYIIIFI